MISEHDFLVKIFNKFVLMPHRYITCGPIGLARELKVALEDVELLSRPYVKQIVAGWGLAIWQGDDGIIRIVKTTPWKRRPRHPGAMACCFCGMREKPDALVAARGANDEIIQNHFVHRQCKKAWHRQISKEHYHGRR